MAFLRLFFLVALVSQWSSVSAAWATDELDFSDSDLGLQGDPRHPQENSAFEREASFLSKNASEARVVFDHQVAFRHKNPPTLSQARRQIEKQLKHVFGPLAAAQYPGAIRGDHQVSKIQFSGISGSYLISYHYEGIWVIEEGASSPYDLILPIDPEGIYDASKRERNGKITYPCTDPHYSSVADFWYFWNPHRDECRLKEGVDFSHAHAGLYRMANSQGTAPDYPRMVDADGVLRVSLLFGMNEPDLSDKNPLTTPDVSAVGYRKVREKLYGMGFQGHRLAGQALNELLASVGGAEPQVFVEDFEKKTLRATLRVRLFFGPTSVSRESSRGFHYLLKDALENAALLVYDGHSGLGGNLDLSQIERNERFKFRPKERKYQIYFFNSCASYTYYNSVFFRLKATSEDPRGTKNLDVLANGLSTDFNVLRDDMALIDAVYEWAKGGRSESYSSLVQKMDSGNLLTVDGD